MNTPPPTRGGSLIAALASLLPLVLGAACAPEPIAADPPLRPLLLTEAPLGSELQIEGFEEWTDPDMDPVAWPTEFSTRSAAPHRVAQTAATTPEDLAFGVFDALTSGDPDALDAWLFEAESLGQASRMNRDTALQTARDIRDATLATQAMLSPRSGGRELSLRPLQVTIGRPRTIDGGLAGPNDEAVMHWGNELSFQIRGIPVEFTLRLPNLLVDHEGHWRLRSAPRPDSRFETWRNLGLDLLPELMDAQHAALPLAVGNYWHYRVRRPSADGQEGGAVMGRSGFRDTVVELQSHDGYRVARLRRVYDDPSRASERFALLVTPLRIYNCTSECVRRAGNLDWLLANLANQTPLYIWPLRADTSWGGEGSRATRVESRRADLELPAGHYADAFEVSRPVGRERESTYIVPGIGIVARHIRTASETRYEELVSYRIMP